ncbi:hypothetical protein HMPREF0321_0994 [Dermacoccus sp. Ellin185]|nr:hypothetical protein HMPREF0321_0994 [Dermacoccus sp. Ellin185]
MFDEVHATSLEARGSGKQRTASSQQPAASSQQPKTIAHRTNDTSPRQVRGIC